MMWVVVQPLSGVCLFVTPWTAACRPSLSFTISWSLLKLVSVELVMPSNHLFLSSSSPHGGRLLLIWHISSTMYLLKELIEPFNSSLLDYKTT